MVAENSTAKWFLVSEYVWTFGWMLLNHDWIFLNWIWILWILAEFFWILAEYFWINSEYFWIKDAELFWILLNSSWIFFNFGWIFLNSGWIFLNPCWILPELLLNKSSSCLNLSETQVWIFLNTRAEFVPISVKIQNNNEMTIQLKFRCDSAWIQKMIQPWFINKIFMRDERRSRVLLLENYFTKRNSERQITW